MAGQLNTSMDSSFSEPPGPPPLPETDVEGVIRIKSDSGAGGSSYTASNAAIEVEAIGFDKPTKSDHRYHLPRRVLLLIIAFLVIMIASAIAGFSVLSGKKKASSASGLLEEGAEILEVTNDDDSETSEAIIIDADEDGVTDFAIDLLDTIVEEATDPPLEDSTDAPTEEVTSESTSESTSEFTTTSTFGEIELDSVCPEHNLVVASSCVEGSANALSTASFCFASKRDGDWYWVRNNVTESDATEAYDSWDYAEAAEGDLTLLDLSTGKYTISLVRDSMQPYDVIISQEFTVPKCE